MAEPAAGVTLAGGRYQLIQRLGGGGMATVWMAQDTRLGREVAVKVISDVLAAQAPYVERFRREARIAAGLSHPNLVKVYDFGSDGERPFLVMEYVEGATLRPGSSGATAPRLDSDTLARELLDALEPHPCRRHRASRHQAGQRARRTGRSGSPHRLRNRPGRRTQPG